jgi:2-polyprenyl-3-methyl-5-hydroxy-6-metoxy-1,4-benzoquinol methylase
MSDTAEQFADRIFASALGMAEILSIHIGDRLGLYRAFAGSGHTSLGLAEAAGVDERYAREWLEQQATYDLLEVDLTDLEPIFTLPAAHHQVLVDGYNSLYLAPLARMLATAAQSMGPLLEAYRSGGGVTWDAFGQDMRESQADLNRPFFDLELAGVFADLDEAHGRMSSPEARIADVGCGAGWSTLALARAYPAASFHGFDIDAPSIEMARRNASGTGLNGRVSFSSDDITQGGAGKFDVAVAFECIHDMSQPVPVLKAMREMVGDDGVVVIMDEAVGESFTGEGDDIEKLMYGASLLVCLPDGMSSKPSVGTGTVMRPSTLRAYAEAAGFTNFRVVGEAGFFRFYELT